MKKLTILTFAAFFMGSVSFAQQVAPFKAGDRVAFVGNSITDGGHYHSYIWLYYMTRFPMARMWMANCGIGGDTAENILARLDGDVYAQQEKRHVEDRLKVVLERIPPVPCRRVGYVCEEGAEDVAHAVGVARVEAPPEVADARAAQRARSPGVL